MAAQRKYPEELRERAVKMVSEIREQDGKGHGELARIGRQLGVHPEALRSWIKQAEIDGGERPGITVQATMRTRRNDSGTHCGKRGLPGTWLPRPSRAASSGW